MRVILLFLFFSSLTGFSFAQNITSYVMSSGNNGSMAGMGGSSQLIGPNQSDVSSPVTDIGFDVVYMGKVYNSFSVNTNGVLRLGAEQVLAGANTYGIPGNARIVPLTSVSVQRITGTTCFFGFCWDNYETVDDGWGTNNNGKVHYRVVGAAPNRQLLVEWRNMEMPVGTGDSNGSFRVRLYESAPGSTDPGRIDFIYGNISLSNGYRNAYYRMGFGIGPESGNYYSINPVTNLLSSTLNYTVGPVDNFDVFDVNGGRKYFTFVSNNKPAGIVSNINSTCPSPNVFNVQFDENGITEAGIVVMRKPANASDEAFQVIKRLPPDARAFSDGTFTPGTSYVYRFYLIGEGIFSDSYVDYTQTPGTQGSGLQPVESGKWSQPVVWGAATSLPTVADDVTIGCVSPVFVDIDTDAQTHDLTIESGSFLTVKDGTTLEIAGDFINNGVFTVEGSGKVLFSGSADQNIVNNGFGVTNDSTLSVSPGSTWAATGLGLVSETTISVPNSGFSGLKSVTVDLDYDKMRNITLYLVAPDGKQIKLIEGRGQNGEDLDNVTFRDTGQPLPPSIQNVNLSGVYRPEETLSTYNGTYAGNWKLRVFTTFAELAGRLNRFDLTLSKGGSNDIVFNDMEVDKVPGSFLYLQSGLRVTGEMRLRRGVFISSDAHPVTFTEGATTNSGNANSYIDGPAVKEGDDFSFVFPLGKDGKWAPLRIWNPRGADSNLKMRAEYFNNKPGDVDNLKAGLERVSKLEYWDIHHDEGSLGSIDMTFYWKNADESDITDLTMGDLVIAHYTGGQWQSEGGSFISGSATGGSAEGGLEVTGISSFSPFTFGSSTGLNPLPVELLYFEGEGTLSGNMLEWATTIEKQNDRFELYRSRNARDWSLLTTVKGAGDSEEKTTYSYLDASVQGGDYYYMLKQYDVDGTSEQLDIVRVSSIMQGVSLSAYPNPVSSESRLLTVSGSQVNGEASIELMAVDGRIVRQMQISGNGEPIEVNCEGVPAGVYLLRLSDGHTLETVQVMFR
ncbi:T9SS type A sorting domain-containing protein [Roseivirga sp. BDSF3-8]|uniref:T9SS type A sorting domain-containing protein n=1 Tax=Roseivirga sp. BDSF3-8 TaxID=3241598 RepID=UPI0035324662